MRQAENPCEDRAGRGLTLPPARGDLAGQKLRGARKLLEGGTGPRPQPGLGLLATRTVRKSTSVCQATRGRPFPPAATVRRTPLHLVPEEEKLPRPLDAHSTPGGGSRVREVAPRWVSAEIDSVMHLSRARPGPPEHSRLPTEDVVPWEEPSWEKVGDGSSHSSQDRARQHLLPHHSPKTVPRVLRACAHTHSRAP